MKTQTRKALRSWVDETSAEFVADQLYVSPDTVARWMAGMNLPSPATLARIEARLAERKAAK